MNHVTCDIERANDMSANASSASLAALRNAMKTRCGCTRPSRAGWGHIDCAAVPDASNLATNRHTPIQSPGFPLPWYASSLSAVTGLPLTNATYAMRCGSSGQSSSGIYRWPSAFFFCICTKHSYARTAARRTRVRQGFREAPRGG